ncbi:hypothetical protein ABOM_003836 [Aspergillus bombycis]|uniref:Uncharacterized protein n=1 Tax=Aspergillus bombycis TaxID=109264 RepID=A0A1F8A6J4_9EURO|nr:hypothetical protein ABOM_003836 [Aspergillus bombycis]OGM47324.1 hypothetical protein ABOM_003836 [Aspergillus bombycis]
MNTIQGGAEVRGERTKYAQFAHLTTRLSGMIHEGSHGPISQEPHTVIHEDHITGKYVFINIPYHAVMNDPSMRKKCRMIAFDLPVHGRSFPGETIFRGTTPTPKTPTWGEMVCIAVAIRAEVVGAGGSILLQACDYLTTARDFDDNSPFVKQSLFNPDLIYGVMAPSAPLANKQVIWHLHSAQAYGIFHGDLDFYLGGFDARG